MQHGRIGMLIALTVALGATGTVMAQEPSVVTPEDLNAARAVERNTHHDEQFGFSITKPEEWTWYLDITDRAGIGYTTTDSESIKLRAIPIVISRFSRDAEWVLLNPRVSVQVYEVMERVPPEGESQALDSIQQQILLLAQADPEAATQVLLPPTVVEIKGVSWRKFGTSAKMSYRPSVANESADSYIETSLTFRQQRLFVVNFMARMVDVPLYRHEVDGIIRSIVFEDGVGKKDVPGAKTEL